jgi:hypothetical protein
MAATSTELRLGQRFCGPPGIANGGFACGSIVALVGRRRVKSHDVV